MKWKFSRSKAKFREKVRDQIDKNQREYYLREQMKVIQSELGENDTDAEVEKYKEKIEALKLPDEHSEKLLKEVNRLSKMSSTSAESGVIRTYLDTVLSLPWNKTTKEQHNLKKAEEILNREHYGLEKVKERNFRIFSCQSV